MVLLAQSAAVGGAWARTHGLLAIATELFARFYLTNFGSCVHAALVLRTSEFINIITPGCCEPISDYVSVLGLGGVALFGDSFIQASRDAVRVKAAGNKAG